MKIAITGGTGFVGSALARRLVRSGHEVVLLSRGRTPAPTDLRARGDVTVVTASVRDGSRLRSAFEGCDAVAHLAGINRERGTQTFEGVHVEGTELVVTAATDAGVSRLALTSYLRARPNCGSGYHESKWRAEDVVRRSELEFTIVKPAAVYGRGDHLLTHVARSLLTVPVFPRVGLRERRIRPLAIGDFVDVLAASLVKGRLSETTVAVLGPEELSVAEMVRRIGDVIDRNPAIVPAPVRGQYLAAWMQERAMETPIVSRAAIRMLAEEMVEPAPEGACDPLPDDLEPTQSFSTAHVESELPALGRYGFDDLRASSDR